MSINVGQLMSWLNSLDKNDEVWIDDGGLTLINQHGCYLEVGGRSDDDDD